VGAGEAETGVLLFDKPAGVTSHDVVATVRRERGMKAGHAGTLDPFATGLLLVLLGRATRLQRYLLELPKTYVATARLGWRSSTGDPDGELTETGRLPARLELPTGRVRQRVPMTSAVRVGGERLYRKAHRGEEVERPEREVEVHRVELLESGGGRATFEVHCSSGTYVRTLIETLGDAYCEQLRRTAIGSLTLERAGETLEPAEALGFMEQRSLAAEEAEAISHGRAIEADPEAVGREAETVALTFAGKLLAVARADDEMLRPEVVLG
jgi:tRNA pseudouridine55 synthase